MSESVCMAVVWAQLFGTMPAVGTAPAEFEKLTRRHAAKLNPAVQCPVEDPALAVGDVVGHKALNLCRG